MKISVGFNYNKPLLKLLRLSIRTLLLNLSVMVKETFLMNSQRYSMFITIPSGNRTGLGTGNFVSGP